MSARDDLSRAADEARTQVGAAREALASSRDAVGGSARNARQAERQLHELRRAVTSDVHALRDRLTTLDPSARRGAATAAIVGVGALATLFGSGLAVRSKVRRSLDQRGVQKQAVAIARAMLASDGDDVPLTRGRRRGRGALLAALAVGAAVAGAALVQQRSAPVDDDDLWLPERQLDPAPPTS